MNLTYFSDFYQQKRKRERQTSKILVFKPKISQNTLYNYFTEAYMQIDNDNDKLTILLDDRLDVNTVPETGAKINQALGDTKYLVLDFRNVDYVSSMGLRMLLELQKKMKEQGRMELTNVGEDVMNVLTMTGFAGILNIVK